MGTFSIWHWLIVLAVALLLFGGGGKITRIMGDIGSGMRGFRKNLTGDEEGGKSSSIAAKKSKSASKKRSSKKKSSAKS